jgi:ActR/RegA family two-component response regulator
MTGSELAKVLQPLLPDAKILFTTGYTRNAIVHNGVLDAGTHLISKPYTINDLAEKVRALLDGL